MSRTSPGLRRVTLRTGSLLLLGLAAGCGGESDPEADYQPRHFSWRRVRIVISDAQSGRLSLFDAEDEAVTHSFDTGGPATVEPSFTGDHAVVTTATGVRLISSGVSILDHVDHVHVYKDVPRLLDVTIGTSRPASSSANGEHLLFSFAGTNVATNAVLVNERKQPPSSIELSLGAGGKAILLSTGLLEFGVAGALGWRPFDMVPSGEPREVPGAPTSCTNAGLSRAVAGHAVLACSSGFLNVHESAGVVTTGFLANPAGGTAMELMLHPLWPALTARTTTTGMLHFPTVDSGTQPTPWALPAGACDVALDPGAGDRLVILSATGEVRLTLRDGSPLKLVGKVLPAFTCENPVRPRIAVAPERAYLVDPRSSELVDIDLRTAKVAARYTVPGQPAGLAILGLDPRNAGLRGPRPGEP
jgi:hypothetical protein